MELTQQQLEIVLECKNRDDTGSCGPLVIAWQANESHCPGQHCTGCLARCECVIEQKECTKLWPKPSAITKNAKAHLNEANSRLNQARIELKTGSYSTDQKIAKIQAEINDLMAAGE